MNRLRVAHFTVHATLAQSVRWKQAAEGEAFNSTGAWLAYAADAYLKARARARAPIALGWHRGLFKVELQGEELTVRGCVSPPFGCFRADASGYQPRWGRVHRLVYLPTGRVLATMNRSRDVKALAAELARLWVRGDGSEPATDPRTILESLSVRAVLP